MILGPAILAMLLAPSMAPASETRADEFHPVVPIEIGKWLRNEDYPEWALRDDKGGVTAIDLLVDSSGTPQTCVVVWKSQSPELDAVACAGAVGRGRFEPAADENGQPIAGVFRYRVYFADGRGHDRPPVADVTLAVKALPGGMKKAMVLLYYIVAEDGRIERCRVGQGSGVPALDAAACNAMSGRFTFAPARDKDGKAWRTVRMQRVAFDTKDGS